MRLASLAGDCGAAFDGWMPNAAEKILGGDEKAQLLQVGDRVLSIDGKEVLGNTFAAITKQLRENSTKTRVIQFLRPSLKCEVQMDADSGSLWLEPMLLELQEGGVFAGWADAAAGAAYPKLKRGMAVIAVDGRAACGWALKKLLEVLKEPRKNVGNKDSRPAACHSIVLECTSEETLPRAKLTQPSLCRMIPSAILQGSHFTNATPLIFATRSEKATRALCSPG